LIDHAVSACELAVRSNVELADALRVEQVVSAGTLRNELVPKEFKVDFA
jgi:hypothetical protein